MELELQDRAIFVAGASRGIGRGIARAFLIEGANVVISGRDPKALEEARKDLAREFGDRNVRAVEGDMCASPDIQRGLQRTVDTFGRLDAAIANVGGGGTPLGFDLTDEQWDEGLSRNLKGSMSLAREAFRTMLSQDDHDGCSITFISSIAGIDTMGGTVPYSTSKAALNHAMKELSRLVGPDGIRVNAVAPGNIMFPGGNWERNVNDRPDAWWRWIRREVPLQRFGTVEEIADAVLWITSPRASFVTGECLVVDGGQTRHT